MKTGAEVMTVPQKVNLKHYRGDSLALKLRLWADPNKTVPVDLEGAEVTAVVKYVMESAQRQEAFAVTVEGNEVNLALVSEQTAGLPSTCKWDCQVLWPPATVQTVAFGDVTFIGEVTP